VTSTVTTMLARNGKTAVAVQFWRGATGTLLIAFFASGVSAITYQLVWQRVLFRVFGVNIESVTVVVTAFMLGLGFGAMVGSWLAGRKTVSPLLIFAVLEAATAAFGLVSLKLLESIGSTLGESSLAIRGLATVGILLVPTGCMGATLPLLVGYAVRKSANVGAVTGYLYYINTFGAVIGCSLAVFGFFPFLGIGATVRIAALLNIVACAGAAIAVVRSRAERLTPVEQPTGLQASSGPRSSLRIRYLGALILAGCSGFIALSYEIFFLHVTSFASGSNSLVLGLMLAAILLGMASGARELGEQLEKSEQIPTRFFAALIWASVLGLLVLPMLANSAFLKKSMVFALLPIAILISRALGAVFPLMAHMAASADGKAGRRVGYVYASNILGSTLGTLLTGFVLTDVVGLRGLALLLALFMLGLTLTLAMLTGLLHQRRLRRLEIAGIVAAVALIVFQGPLTNGLFETVQLAIDRSFSGKAVTVIENRSGIILESQNGTVYGGGIYDGAFNVDPYHDVNGIIRPYSLSLFHPDPKEVLMIGLASGSWAQVVVNDPYVQHLTIVEINPGYPPLIRHNPIVQSLLSNPKVRLVIDDGHRWLEAHPQATFDAVLANTTFHYRAYSSNMLSTEFDRLIQRHLNQGGVYLYNTTGSIRAVRTGCLTFRYGYRVLNNVMVSDSPFDLDAGRWRQVLTSYTIDGHVMFPQDTPEHVQALDAIVAMAHEASDDSIDPAARRLESCQSIVQRINALPLITDDNMGTEWRYPLLHLE
jgi:spermidine synthase